jgi:succinoglycan biosynthesis transport protein ExoP
MDGIQPYTGGPYPTAHPPAAHPAYNLTYPHPHAGPSQTLPAKGAGDYLRAIRKRAWLVVAVGVLLSVAGTLFVLRMPAVYRVVAEITIEPPKYDQFLSSMLNAERLVPKNNEELEKYVPDKIALLKSKSLIDKVVRDPSVTGGKAISPLDDPAAEVIKNLYTRNQAGTHFYTISLDGGDPAKVTRTLGLVLEEFKDLTRVESRDTLDQSRGNAVKTLETLANDLKELHAKIQKIAQESGTIGPGGTSLAKERYQTLQQKLLMEQARFSDLDRNLRLGALRPAPLDPRQEARAKRIADLMDEREMLVNRYTNASSKTRNRADPALREMATKIRHKDAEIDRLEAAPASQEAPQTDDAEVILSSAQEEIRMLETQAGRLMDEMRDSMPIFDQYQELVSLREQKQKQMSDTAQMLSQFDAISKTQKDPVKIMVPPVEPVMPDRPKKGLYIGAIVVFGFLLGVGLAVLLEHLDHSVKVPEHLTSGLALPLLGVVPRIRRTAKVQRGGHLWTPGAPDSIEADAYRNVRASLVGVAGAHGPIVTLLITSAKAGEGKSTTALNLAATCARAGERTLLVDVDLRRPSLAGVFPHEEGHLGLVDVLRGEVPWQRVVVPTDLPNLDFLPTGEARDVPIEILGSLELRQLILSLSQHHYDRVILDGPAVLGLADCRMLGRIVDAAVMVVRSGTLQLRPLRRAKSMLEQSQVKLAGVIFNGLSDDLDNWSSYGPGPSPMGGPALFGPGSGLGGPATLTPATISS